MINYFLSGGGFMWPSTILAIVIVALSIKKAIELYGKNTLSTARLESGLNAIPFWGGICVLIGFLAHYWGVNMAMNVISKANDISPAIVAAGYSMSLIPIIFGLMIFMFSATVWFILWSRFKKLVSK